MDIEFPGDSTESEPVGNTNDQSREAEDLGRVRDILFGRQLREIQDRCQALETDIQGQLASALEKAREQNDAFESRLEDQINSLKETLEEERAERAKSLADMTATTATSIKELEDHFIEITDQIDEENVGRADLARMFGSIVTELGTGGGSSKKTPGNALFNESDNEPVNETEAIGELQPDDFH